MTRRTQVAECIAVGMPNKLIARKLGMAPATVKPHAYILFKQLGVSNRTQAALILSGRTL